MRFSYRIYSKNSSRAVKTQKNFQTPRLDDEEKKKSKRQSSLEQQKQNEYLGNFNLNPTNSSIYRNQSYNKTRHNTTNNNNNNNSVKNNNTLSERKQSKAYDEYVFRDGPDSEDGSRDKMFPSSEESNTSGLQIISEKEDSLKGNSDDSRQSSVIEEIGRRKFGETVTSFEEEALDGFSSGKLLRNKQKGEGKRGKRKSDGEVEKRRKSVARTEGLDESKKKSPQAKRRKSMADEYSLSREVNQTFSIRRVEDSMANLKIEALRKVFVAKDKPEVSGKKKDGESRKKKRKKSKHHEGETKKRKLEMVTSSPSIMSFGKDALKFKFKLTSNKSVTKVTPEEKEAEKTAEVEKTEEVVIKDDDDSGNSDKEVKKIDESENKKSVLDKERLLHLRAVRHKAIGSKQTSPKDYINTPPSLTISKIDTSEQQPVKSSLVESRPSLEIMLVSPTDATKGKKPEQRTEGESQKVESNGRQRSDVVDNFGVLDLSEKSTRTKENSNSSSPKEMSETIERCRKSTHQSILHIAQTLVNRKLSPILPENQLVRGFDRPSDSAATAAAMRNLKTLSDTAVNILMAAQSNSFAGCAAAAAAAAAAELQKRPFSALTSSAHKALTGPNSTKITKDCENGTALKIPVYPIGRDRTNSIPPVPNLHEIFPRGRGRPMSLGKTTTPLIKPGQNQTVRQIPNPFVVLNRQTNQNATKGSTTTVPPLQMLKTKVSTPKTEEGKEVTCEVKNGVSEVKATLPKILNNNNTKPVQNGGESNFFGLKNGVGVGIGAGGGGGGGLKLNNNTTTMRKIENMAKNIESVAAGLTARAVSNAMIDAK